MKGLTITAFILSLVALAIGVTVLFLVVPASEPVANGPSVSTPNNGLDTVPTDTGDIPVEQTEIWEPYITAFGQSILIPPGWQVTDTSIDDYATLEDATEVSGAHFALQYLSSLSQGVEGPSVWAGGGAKVEVFVYTDIPATLEAWVEQVTSEQARADEALGVGTDQVVAYGKTINGVPAAEVYYEGGVYGGSTLVTYLIKDGVGYGISLYSEDAYNSPQEALDVVASFKAE